MRINNRKSGFAVMGVHLSIDRVGEDILATKIILLVNTHNSQQIIKRGELYREL